MAALDTFPDLPQPGEISICERNGRICTLPINEVDASSSGNLAAYPEINIGRELFHHAAVHLREDHRTLMVPVNETLIKRITRTFFEDGTVEALNEAANIDSHQYNPIVGTLSRYLLALIGVGNRVKFFFKPHLKEQGVHCVGKYTQTKDWSRSAIRCIRWHPNCFKVAIAASDDSIRVYSDEPTIVPVLKSGLQKSVTSLAWRPLTAGELAVGCQNGTLVWSVDPNSLITRPLSQAIHLKYGNHFPVTSVEWSPNGCLLATASINDSDVLIWDVDQNRQEQGEGARSGQGGSTRCKVTCGRYADCEAGKMQPWTEWNGDDFYIQQRSPRPYPDWYGMYRLCRVSRDEFAFMEIENREVHN